VEVDNFLEAEDIFHPYFETISAFNQRRYTYCHAVAVKGYCIKPFERVRKDMMCTCFNVCLCLFMALFCMTGLNDKFV